MRGGRIRWLTLLRCRRFWDEVLEALATGGMSLVYPGFESAAKREHRMRAALEAIEARLELERRDAALWHGDNDNMVLVADALLAIARTALSSESASNQAKTSA